MSDSFNLIDEDWIPCIMRGDGSDTERRCKLGLRDVLINASDIQEIGDLSPLVTVSLHRLLLAIVHRMIDGPRDVDHWADIWEPKRWDSAVIDAYLTRPNVRARFDLFGDEHPFYQATSIGPEYAQPIAKVTHELASGNNVTLFDHTTRADAPVFTPAQAARYLIAYQVYAVGGLVSFEKGQDPKVYKSAPAAPLVKGAVALARGVNLFETLMLNLVEYDINANRPFRGQRDDDCPAWERAKETCVVERQPDGYLDYLTWQSRRIRFFPSRDMRGNVVVREVAIMKGYVLSSDERYRCETMVAFRDAPKSPDPHPAVGFRSDKTLWRDSLSIFQHSQEDNNRRPKSLDWLSQLRVEGVLDRTSVPLDMLGMVTDQASVLLWRHERLPLPLAYLLPERGNLRNALAAALRFAEEVGRALGDACRTLATHLLTPDADRRGARQPASGDITNLATSFDMGRAYWPQLETRFKDLLVALPGDAVEQQEVVRYGQGELPRWGRDVVRAARIAFSCPSAGLDRSARSLKAVTLARSRLERAMAEVMEKSGLGIGRQEGDAT